MARAHDDVAAAYDRWASVYDSDRNPTRDLDGDVLRRECPESVSGDVLEVGCGTGKNTAWLAGRARSLTAMDFSEGMLARARGHVRDTGVRWVHHDIREPWPLPGQSFDLVLVNLVLEHVQDVAPVMQEAARVLRTGGDLFACELHPERQRRGGQAHFEDPSTGGTTYVPAFPHTVSELLDGALQAGFELSRIGEWLEDGAPADAPPRLLSLHLTTQ